VILIKSHHQKLSNQWWRVKQGWQTSH